MMAQLMEKTQEAALAPKLASATQYVFFFGEGKADGNAKMKSVLGGKGAGLAEMTLAGLPVPPGFTIQTEACREYMRGGRSSDALDHEMLAALHRLEELQGQRLGQGDDPLLVSVRSGAAFSMPGMMDTILNLGLNDASVEALASRTDNPRFAYDSYRRFIQMFGSVVLDIPRKTFDELLYYKKKKLRVTSDVELDVEALRDLVAGFKHIIKNETGRGFPEDPIAQLRESRDAVFRSWDNDRARHYRRINSISHDLGTACNVQAMVFGNMGPTSGTGVGFTRNPSTGAREFYGEFLMNAQGEDVVAGIRTPIPISELAKSMPDVYRQLEEITQRLERHYRDVQDFEFTIQQGRLYMLQTRNGKRAGRAAVRIAVEMVDEKLLTEEEALFRVQPNQLYECLLPRLDDTGAIEVLTKGLPASPGGAVGQIVFTADDAVTMAGPDKKVPVILVRNETTPEDIHGMEVAVGILTATGGMTSHAAVVTRGMGKCCVAGAGELEVDEKHKELRVKGHLLKAGDWISLDGSTGRVILGKLNTVEGKPDDPQLERFMQWVEKVRRLRVRANADIPRDALKAREFGAEGIGLCRTEHMFFAADRLAHMREMIMSTSHEQRQAALAKLLPMQREDFLGIFRAMNGFPVTIRLLDPPLHEFLPRREDLMVEITKLALTQERSPRLAELRKVLERVEQLHEANPMLGHRGCRLSITYPEIAETQARAIFEAAVDATKEGVKVFPEVMVPLVGTRTEMANQDAIVRRIADAVFAERGAKVEYLVGTMIELPRAALVADKIAEVAQFFSFGTNDMTQTTFGISRDDVNRFLPSYLAEGILEHDPFAILDREGVGQLLEMAVERGRKTNPRLKIGICGEHGGEPSSVEFCHQIGLDYVSCSPFRVLTARLAAAQAALSGKGEGDRTK